LSRGHGRIQRAILDYLATDPGGRYKSGAPMVMPLYRVTCAIFGVSRPTDSQRASARRAARQLHRAGLISLTERLPAWGKDDPDWRSYWRRSRWSTPGGELEEVRVCEMYVGRLPTAEEAAAQAAAYKAFLRRL
jgi:hypothetical protein